MRVEGAAFDQRDTHRGEISIACDVEVHLVGVGGGTRDALKKNQVVPCAGVKREERKAVRLYAGNGLDAGFDLLLKVDRADLVRCSMGQISRAGIK